MPSQTFGDRFVLETFNRQQNDLGLVGEPLRTRTIGWKPDSASLHSLPEASGLGTF